jgi:hypothetical protein
MMYWKNFSHLFSVYERNLNYNFHFQVLDRKNGQHDELSTIKRTRACTDSWTSNKVSTSISTVHSPFTSWRLAIRGTETSYRSSWTFVVVVGSAISTSMLVNSALIKTI